MLIKNNFKLYSGKFLFFILILILIVWLGISVLRTTYNISKIFTEEKNWIFISDEEQRAKLFGDLYFLYKFVEASTPKNSNIIFISPGGKAYYLGRYYLYPRKVIYVKNPKEMNKLSLNKYNFILMYQTSDPALNEYNSLEWKLEGFNSIATYSLGKNSKGTLYKL